MRIFRGLTKEQTNDMQKYDFLQLGIDQNLHDVVILILAFFIK